MLAEWASKRQLNFNVGKCDWLHLRQQHGFSEYTNFNGGTVIASCNVARDQRIQIDSQLKFHEHRAAVTKKANQLLSIIHTVFHYFDKATYPKLIFDLFWSMEMTSRDLYLS